MNSTIWAIEFTYRVVRNLLAWYVSFPDCLQFLLSSIDLHFNAIRWRWLLQQKSKKATLQILQIFWGVFPTTVPLVRFLIPLSSLWHNHLTFISCLHAYLIMSCRYCICCFYLQYVVVVVAIAVAFFYNCCFLLLFPWYLLSTCVFFYFLSNFFLSFPITY